MKPDFYSKSRYFEVFDLFSSSKIFPILGVFRRMLKRAVDQKLLQKKDISICDMGAGTGYSSSLLLIQKKDSWSHITYTFCEPNRRMLNVLKKKVPQFENKTFINKTAQEALKEIQKQDIFIFERCLYAFYSKSEKDNYYSFAKNLYEKTTPEGIIMISDFSKKMNISRMKISVERNKQKIGLSSKNFNKYWDIFERSLYDFNNHVDSNKITLLSNEFLIDVFTQAGFTKKQNAGNILIFQK